MPRKISPQYSFFQSVSQRSVGMVLSLLLAGLMISVPVHAVYVKDSLRVGVRPEPRDGIGPSAVVVTGMKLTILKSSGNYIKIRSKSGIVGWIKRTYVSSEPPALVRLQALQKEHTSLNAQLEQQAKAVQIAELNAQALTEEISHLKKDNTQLHLQLDDERNVKINSRYGYIWKILLVLGVCVGGFSAGVVWHRKLAMRRLGGLRV